MDREFHLPDETLLLHLDGELLPEAGAPVRLHLQDCPYCRARLARLQQAANAYGLYHDHVLKPSLQLALPARPSLLASSSAPGSRHHSAPWRFAFAVAAAVIVISLVGVAVYLRAHSAHTRATQLLTAAVAVPDSPHRALLVSTGRHRWSRAGHLTPANDNLAVPPADASSAQHVHALFVEANYSWDDPLSARSFARWRDRLPEKRDQVTVIRGADGARDFYRVRTSTPAGILQTASLTLRAGTYRSTDARFDFRGEDPVEISEAPPAPIPARPAPRPDATVAPPKPVETAATPADELRVFAALSALDADAEEPINVRFDAARRRVLVTAVGLPRERQQALSAALAPLPHTVVRFASGQPAVTSAPPHAPATSSSSPDSAFRKSLEERAGGARSLELLTGQALDSSSALFAQAHSLAVLAGEFPPPVESALRSSDRGLLFSLRKRHLRAMRQAVQRLTQQLSPLLPGQLPATAASSPPSVASWQIGAQTLLTSARRLDQSLSHLLAGSDTPPAGSDVLHDLPADLSQLQALLKKQNKTPP